MLGLFLRQMFYEIFLYVLLGRRYILRYSQLGVYLEFMGFFIWEECESGYWEDNQQFLLFFLYIISYVYVSIYVFIFFGEWD